MLRDSGNPDSSVEKLAAELGYLDSPFYVTKSKVADAGIAHLLRDAQQRADVEGTYLIRTTANDQKAGTRHPVVHLARAESQERAREIHRQVWNQGATPFLVVLLPGQVRVYTGFAYDHEDESVGRIEEPLDESLGFAEIAKRLAYLRAQAIDRGETWERKGGLLRKDTRVDVRLLNALLGLSRHLADEHGLEPAVANALVGRFVYLYYLRDRNIASTEWLADEGIAADDVFSRKPQPDAFRRLSLAVDKRFNGSIFPINWDAPGAPDHSAIVSAARTFAGEDLKSGQTTFFRAFDFSFIPIELLSAIYEKFLHAEGRADGEGAFYTPPLIADYVLAEAEAVERLALGMKVFDASCGSGVFLVLAFRRLVEEEMRRRNVDTLQPTELKSILTTSIFGVERNADACHVAEFSLILALLSYISPPELHAHPDFQFPPLRGNQIFECDFFDPFSDFAKTRLRFDLIIGNPPWSEVESDDTSQEWLVKWVQQASKSGEAVVARMRTSEAFSWKVMERLADGGTAALLLQATSLTNDQSEGFRRAFFARHDVHRVTNFSNLAYLLFESAEEPAAAIVYRRRASDNRPDITHFGPLVMMQPAAKGRRGQRTPWVLTIGESEIQSIPREEAEAGRGTTWKCALWGTQRDGHALERLRRLWPITLRALAEQRGWRLSLGLQLRPDEGSDEEPNDDKTKELRGLSVLTFPKRRAIAAPLRVPDEWLVKNKWGCFLRDGRDAGLAIIQAPHVFFWNDFAAFSDREFILRHPKIGLAGPSKDTNWLRAIALLWSCSITRYIQFLDLSSSWGISRSTIDLGDVERVPLPDLTEAQVEALADAHRSLTRRQQSASKQPEIHPLIDEAVASVVEIPTQIMLLAQELSSFRLPLVKGKAPRALAQRPKPEQLERYAQRLKSELDSFVARKSSRHRVTIQNGSAGIVAMVALTKNPKAAIARVEDASEETELDIATTLQMAQDQLGQWVYVQRSVRVFRNNCVYVCKPARALEWTETQAMLDASDIIAEVAESRGQNR